MTDTFLYCWRDHKTEKLYVGVHRGSPEDGYICSSKVVLQEYKKRPRDFSREILASGTWPMMYQLETSLLSALQAHKDPMFYNQTNNQGAFYHIGQKTEDHKRKISVGQTGKKRGPHSLEHSKAQSAGQLGKKRGPYSVPIWNKGLKTGPQTKAHTAKYRGRIPWNKGKKGLQVGKDNPFYGKTHSPSSIAAMSAAHMGNIPWNKGQKKCL